jgi:ribosomal protein S3
MNRLNEYRARIYNYELKYLCTQITDPYYGTVLRDGENISIFCPAMVVSKVLEHHFGFENYFRLNVHGIDVDTQQNTVVVNIKLHRPGLLIGRAGHNIDEIKNELCVMFGRDVRIDITEIKIDKNLPLVY